MMLFFYILDELEFWLSTDFQRYIEAADTDGDGIIDFEEWIEMMRHIYDTGGDDDSSYLY